MKSQILKTVFEHSYGILHRRLRSPHSWYRPRTISRRVQSETRLWRRSWQHIWDRQNQLNRLQWSIITSMYLQTGHCPSWICTWRVNHRFVRLIFADQQQAGFACTSFSARKLSWANGRFVTCKLHIRCKILHTKVGPRWFWIGFWKWKSFGV